MGGRGSFSTVHGGVASSSNGAGSLYVSEEPETREDIRKLFIDELGFSELYGTNKIPTAQLAALAIELKKYERKYNVINDGKTYLSITNEEGVMGAAMQMRDGSKMMFINPDYHTSVKNSNSILKAEQKSGYVTKTNNEVNKQFTYTGRHEYGHLLQYTMRKQIGGSADQADNKMRQEIRNIATTKYGAKEKNPSAYGSTNRREFFAESFASMTGGNPNAYGKAMNDWLKKRGK